MVPEGVSASAVKVASPSGEPVDLRVERANGSEILRFPVDIPFGVYTMSWNGEGGEMQDRIVLSREIHDSVLARQDPEVQAGWFEKADFQYVELSGKDKDQSWHQRVPLWPWLIGLSCLLFLIEMYLVHRVCPAGAPNLAASVVGKGKILSTTPDSEPAA